MATLRFRFFCPLLLSLLFTTMASAQWQFEGGVIVLHRLDQNDAPMIADTFGTEIGSSSDFDLGAAAGLYVSGERIIDDFHSLQIRYFGVDNWSDTQTVSSDFGAKIATTPTVGTQRPIPASAVSTYESAFYSGELNLITAHNNWLECFVGFRMMELNEDFESEIVSRDLWSYEGEFENAVDNHLYGGQIGLRAFVANHRGWDIDLVTAIGFFGNHAEHSYYYEGNGNTVSNSDTVGGFTTLFEMGILGTYQVTETCFIRGGYELLWLNGVALAGSQIPVATINGPTGGITTDGDVFLHGISVQVVCIPR